MKVLLSIKPEFAEKIFSGEKKYEFRRTIFKNRKVTQVVVYASSPVKMVIGEFEIERVLMDAPEALWEKTKRHSGISRDFFFQYFSNKDAGYAIKVKSIKKYKRPLCIRQHFNAKPPQSFMYI